MFIHVRFLTFTCTGKYKIALVNVSETSQLSCHLEECLSEVNSVIEEGCIIVEWKSVQVELFLGGDEKVNFLINTITLKTLKNWCLIDLNLYLRCVTIKYKHHLQSIQSVQEQVSIHQIGL